MSASRCSVCGRTDTPYDLWQKRLQDLVIFSIGVWGIWNELAVVPEPRPLALLFVGAITGVPFVLQADSKRRRKMDDD